MVGGHLICKQMRVLLKQRNKQSCSPVSFKTEISTAVTKHLSPMTHQLLSSTQASPLTHSRALYPMGACPCRPLTQTFGCSR